MAIDLRPAERDTGNGSRPAGRREDPVVAIAGHTHGEEFLSRSRPHGGLRPDVAAQAREACSVVEREKPISGRKARGTSGATVLFGKLRRPRPLRSRVNPGWERGVQSPRGGVCGGWRRAIRGADSPP